MIRESTSTITVSPLLPLNLYFTCRVELVTSPVTMSPYFKDETVCALIGDANGNDNSVAMITINSPTNISVLVVFFIKCSSYVQFGLVPSQQRRDYSTIKEYDYTNIARLDNVQSNTMKITGGRFYSSSTGCRAAWPRRLPQYVSLHLTC